MATARKSRAKPKPAKRARVARKGAPSEAYDVGKDPTEGAAVPPSHSPNAPFLLAYHPSRLTVIDGRVMPVLANVRLQAGVNECEWMPDGRGGMRPRTARVIANWTERGYTVIPLDKGPGGKSYMKRTAVRGGWHHCTVWATLYAGTDRMTSDSAGYVDWIEALLDDGTLAPMSEYAVIGLGEKAKAELADALDRARTVPSAAGLADRKQADLDAIEAMLGEPETLTAAEGEPTTVELSD